MIHFWNPLGIITAIYNRWSKKKDRRADACSKFREVFNKSLEGLYPMPSNWPKGTGIEPTLRKMYPTLQAAVNTFRPFVPDDQKAAFDMAWRDYHTPTKRDIDQDYTHYMNMGGAYQDEEGKVTTTKSDGKANFRRNVDRLLAFAQDT